LKNYTIGRLVIAEAEGAFPYPGAITSPTHQASLCFQSAFQQGNDLVLEGTMLEAINELNDEQAYDIARRIAEQFYSGSLV